MTAKVFLDTNILVYAAVGTGKDDKKRERALALIESEEFGTSAQVLQEFFLTGDKEGSSPSVRRTSAGVDGATDCLSLLSHRSSDGAYRH